MVFQYRLSIVVFMGVYIEKVDVCWFYGVWWLKLLSVGPSQSMTRSVSLIQV